MGAFQGPKEWGSLITAMVSPMREDGSLDLDEAARLANFLVDEQKSSGIVVAGTTGESPTLNDSEKLELLRVVLATVRGKAAVLFGAGTYDTQHSKKMAGAATEMGAHGIMLVSPYYSKPSQDGLYEHFKVIAGGTDLPVLLYNIQGRTSVNIETATVLRLAKDVPNICAVKEASGNLAQVAEVCASKPEGFRVYSGDDILTLPIMSVGGIGIVSVVSHIVGSDIAAMMEQFWKDPFTAMEMGRKMVPLIKAVFCTTNPSPIKFAVSQFGFRTETLRLPMIPLTDNQKKTVLQAMREYGLLLAKV
jgi:4-hydroxy-tetrahydrodipicolinate synthase